MHSLKTITTVLIAICSAVGVFCQTIPLSSLHAKVIDKKDGLKYNYVQTIYQDANGFMWIGGPALQRYDGFRFKTYLDGGGTYMVKAVIEDNDKTLWAGTDVGLYKYDKQKDAFVLFQDSIQTPAGKKQLKVTQMECDPFGTMWIPNIFCLAKLSPGEGKATDAASLFNNLNNPGSQSISKDANGNLWLAAAHEYGILKYNTREKKYYHHTNNPNNEAVFNLKTAGNKFLWDTKGNFWITNSWNDRVLKRFDTATEKLTQYNLLVSDKKNTGNAVVEGLHLDAKGNLWAVFAEHAGLARFNYATNDFEYLYSSNNTQGAVLNSLSIANPGGSLYIDKKSGFWYGGQLGINYFLPYSQEFFFIDKTNEPVKTLTSSNKITASCNGIVKMNDGYFYGVFYGTGLWKIDKNYYPVEQIKTNSHLLMWDAFSTDGENLFWGDQDQQFFSYNIYRKRTTQIKFALSQKEFLCSHYIQNKETVWIGHTTGGLSKINPSTLSVQTFPFNNASSQVTQRYVSSIIPESDNMFWYSCIKGGLYLFNSSTGTSQKIDLLNINPNLELNIYSAKRYRNDTIVMATNTGIVIYNTTRKSTFLYSIKNGLPNNSITGVVCDAENNNIWFNSNLNGIGRVNVKTGAVSLFAKSLGNLTVTSDMFGSKIDSNKIFFTAQNGYTILNRTLHTDTASPVAVQVTEIVADSNSLNLNNQPANDNTITIKHKTKSLKIKIGTPGFFEALKYYYKINNGDWALIDAGRDIEFFSLPSGTYNLQFKTVADTGIESSITSLQIIVTTPFTKSAFFFILLALLAGAIVYAIYKNRVKQIRRQVKINQDFKQQLAELETTALRSQMNPHFIFNSLNAINRYILKSDKAAASNYLTKFSKLIRSILENSKKQWVGLDKEIEALQLYLSLEAMRFQQQFTYNIHVNENIATDLIQIPPMVVQPFAENAIWHGLLPKEDNCKLNISFFIQQQVLVCEIEDNGIGRDAADKVQKGKLVDKTSVGITGTEKRIALMHKGAIAANEILQIEDLLNSDGTAAGTRVTLKIPFNYT
jgi:ligand-binding sensor domain-containing protein